MERDDSVPLLLLAAKGAELHGTHLEDARFP
jgi:hypothetical protein